MRADLIAQIQALRGCVTYKNQKFGAADFTVGMADWDEDTQKELAGRLKYILDTAILYKEAKENPLIKPKPTRPYAKVQIAVDGSITYSWSNTPC